MRERERGRGGRDSQQLRSRSRGRSSYNCRANCDRELLIVFYFQSSSLQGVEKSLDNLPSKEIIINAANDDFNNRWLQILRSLPLEERLRSARFVSLDGNPSNIRIL